jgi:hypothetical protein
MSASSDVPVLPDDAILLHIGPHKTGTTAIQGALAASRPQLADAGILYPGTRLEHNRPAAAAIQRSLGWEHRKVDRGQWLALADRVVKHSGRSIVSSEVFCEADADAARQIIDDLGRERVHVVVTLRPLEKLLPSNWQQYIKSGYRVAYPDWLTDVLESREKRPITPSFWIRNNHPEVIRRWIDAGGDPRRVLVVIVDSAHPRGLFDSFEDILQLPPNSLNADESGPSNRSLSAYEVELLRQLNRLARSTVSYDDYYRLVKRGAVRSLVEGRAPGQDEPRVTTPGWAIERAREFSKSDVADIGAMGVHVLGDLESLAPTAAVGDDEAVEVTTVPVDLAATFMFDLLEAAIRTEPAAAVPPPATAAPTPRPNTTGARLDQVVARTRARLARTRLAALVRATRG